MIKIQYRDELGNVEATFDSLESYMNYKTSLLNKACEAEEEALRKKKLEEEEHAKRIEKNWSELKDHARTFVSKAKSYGVTPVGVMKLISSAMYDLAEDRCFPAASEEKQPEKIDLLDLLRKKAPFSVDAPADTPVIAEEDHD